MTTHELTLSIRPSNGAGESLYSHAVTAGEDLTPLPAALLYPFSLMDLSSGYPLAERLWAFRQSRAQANPELPSSNMTDKEESGEFYDDYDDEIGLLDQWDAAFLNANGLIVAPTTPELKDIRIWLDRILKYQPSWSALGETWWLLLKQRIQSHGEQAQFILDVGALFTAGQVFERVVHQRFKYEEYEFFHADELRNAKVIQGWQPEPLHWKALHTSWCTQVQRWSGCDSLPDNESAHFTDEQTQTLHQVRLSIVRGDWHEFCSWLNPQDSRHLNLIETAYIVATEKAEDEASAKQIRLQRNALWVASLDTRYQAQAFEDQKNWAWTLRQKNELTEAAELMELNLQQQPHAMNSEHPRLPWLFASNLANLTYLYIKLTDTPRKAYDLLHPIITIMDSDSKWQSIDSELRAKLRANYQASLVHMRNMGEPLPETSGTELLSQAENDWFKAKGSAIDIALDNKQAEQALKLCEEVQKFLTDKGFLPSDYKQLSNAVDKARALRDLGEMASAMTLLTDTIELAQLTEHMHAKQLIPRATVCLAICYKRQGHVDEARALYERLIKSSLAREKGSEIEAGMSAACNNLAILYAEAGQFEQSAQAYMQAQQYCEKRGWLLDGSEKLWLAFTEAKKARNWQLQHDALVKLRDTYQDCADHKVQDRVKQAKEALKIVGDRNWVEKNAFTKFLGKTFNLR